MKAQLSWYVLQGDPNRNFPFQIIVALILCMHFSPRVVKTKMWLEHWTVVLSIPGSIPTKDIKIHYFC